MQNVRNIYFLALSTYTEAIRYRTLWVILCLAIMLTMTNIMVTSLFSWDLGKVSVEFGLSTVAFAGLLLIFFLGMKILADDLERHRIHMLLSRPVTIWQYIMGKYLGLSLVLLITSIILGLSASLSMRYVQVQYPAYIPLNFSWLTFVMALVCQFLSLLIVLALSFFFFSFSSQSFIAVLLTFVSYLVGQNMGLLRQVVLENPYAGVLTGQESLVSVLSWIFPNLHLFDKKHVAAYGFLFGGQEFFLLCLYSCSYSLLLLYVSSQLFSRKEFS